MSWRDRKRGREIIPDRATLQVRGALASWAENGSPVSGCWKITDWLKVVELEQESFPKALVIRSEACGLAQQVGKMQVVQSGDWCKHCHRAATSGPMMTHIVNIVKRLDHLAIAEEKMNGRPGGMGKCIEKIKRNDYYKCGTWKPAWLRGLLEDDDYFEGLVSSSLADDKRSLDKLICYPLKNVALTYICGYKVALLTPSKPDS